MQQLLGTANTIDSMFLWELFLQRLPNNVRMVLASTDDTASLNNLAELADKIVEVATPAVCAVQTPRLLSEVEQLWSEVTRLQGLVKSLSTQCKSRRSSTPTRQSSNTDGLCWYHQKYGEAAHKCRPPCAQVPNNQATH